MEDNFVSFIKLKREEQGISLENLCQGLCRKEMMHSVENGKKAFNKIMEDAILSRLGVYVKNDESFLGAKEYEAWKLRTDIVYYLIRERYDEAKTANAKYGELFSHLSKLDRQFYLRMKSFIMEKEGEADCNIKEVLDESICCSVVKYDFDRFEERILSIQELDSILDSIRLSNEAAEEKKDKYSAVIYNIQNRNYCIEAKSRIYPKAAYYYANLVATNDNLKNSCFRAIIIINEGLEVLRDTESSYYLKELLEVRDKIVEFAKENEIEIITNMKKDDSFDELQIANERICSNREISSHLSNSVLIYHASGVYCINDVIRERRIMLGISPKELADGICDIRTLKSLEDGKTVPQKGVVCELLNRLDLSQNYRKTRQ